MHNVSESCQLNLHAGTPKPNVTLADQSVDSLSINWFVPSDSTAFVANYTVYWSRFNLGIHTETFLFNVTQHSVHELLSNTPYNVTVKASGPLGSQNSTTYQFFTPPKGTA